MNGGRLLDWTKLFDVIDMRAFSSMWYWVAVGVVYLRASGAVLGVPAGLIYRAKREGGQALADCVTLTQLNVRQLQHLTVNRGAWLVGLVFFAHVSLLVMGWGYGWEPAKAVFLLALPLTLLGVYNILTAQEILTTDPAPEKIVSLLLRQRFWAQLTAMAVLALTILQAMSVLMPVLRW